MEAIKELLFWWMLLGQYPLVLIKVGKRTNESVQNFGYKRLNICIYLSNHHHKTTLSLLHIIMKRGINCQKKHRISLPKIKYE